VDTGSVYTILKRNILEVVGYSPTSAKEFQFIVTGSKVEKLPRLRIQRFNCLGQFLERYNVLSHDFPIEIGRYVDGLLGMNFLRQFPIEIKPQSYVFPIISFGQTFLS
jgi:hypothetical protein